MRWSISSALRPALIGGCLGLLYGLAFVLHDESSIVPVEAFVATLIAAALGAFLGWWAWLFARAWKADQKVRQYAPVAIFGLALFIFLMEQPSLRLAQQFREDGATTRGVVVGVFPHDHDQIGYRYVVGTKSYELRGLAPGGATNYVVGDSLRIYYLRSDPTVAVARYPTDTLWSTLAFSLLGASWLVSGGAIMQFYRGSRRPPPTVRLERAG